MTHKVDDGGELLFQLDDELPHRLFLRLGASVGVVPLLIQPTLVADAYRVRVVPLGMCPDAFERTGRLHLAITTDVEVVTDETPVVDLHMVVVELLHGVGSVAAGRRTMNHDQRDLSFHSIHAFLRFKRLNNTFISLLQSY